MWEKQNIEEGLIKIRDQALEYKKMSKRRLSILESLKGIRKMGMEN